MIDCRTLPGSIPTGRSIITPKSDRALVPCRHSGPEIPDRILCSLFLRFDPLANGVADVFFVSTSDLGVDTGSNGHTFTTSRTFRIQEQSGT